jgi:hypothetical protein
LKSIRRADVSFGSSLCTNLHINNYTISPCIYLPLAEETLDETKGISFGTQSERRVGTGPRLKYIQNVPFAYIPM